MRGAVPVNIGGAVPPVDMGMVPVDIGRAVPPVDIGMVPVGTMPVPEPEPVGKTQKHPLHGDASTAVAKAIKQATNSTLNCIAAVNESDKRVWWCED